MAEEKVTTEKKKEIASERRRYVRISPSEPIQVKYNLVKDHGEGEAETNKASSRSVSGGGLFLEMPYLEPREVEELLKGEKKLSLQIHIPNLSKPIKALGQVMWLEGKKEGERYFYGAGVSFVRIDEDDRDEIINYIIDLYLRKKKAAEIKE